MRGKLRIEPMYSAADETWAEQTIATCLDHQDDHNIYYDYDHWEDPQFISDLLKKVAQDTFSTTLKTRINRTKNTISLVFSAAEVAPTQPSRPLGNAAMDTAIDMDMDEDYAALAGFDTPAPAPEQPQTDAAHTANEPERAWLDFLTNNEPKRPKQAAGVQKGAVTVLPPDPKLKRSGDDRGSRESQQQVLMRDILRREKRPLSQDELIELSGLNHLPSVPKGVREIVVRKKDGTRSVRYALEAG